MSVYFIQHGEGGEIKIGTTTGNPYARMASLQTGAPHEHRLLVTVPGGANEERELHERFAGLRARGEWFRPEPGLLHFIDGLKWAFRDGQPKPEAPTDAALGLSFEQFEAIRGYIEAHRVWERVHDLTPTAHPSLLAELQELRRMLGLFRNYDEPFHQGGRLMLSKSTNGIEGYIKDVDAAIRDAEDALSANNIVSSAEE